MMTIKDISGNRYEVERTGCAIVHGDIRPPGGILKETEHFLLHQDPEVPVPGFLIVTAKEHVQSIVQLDRSARHELIDLVNEAVNAVKEGKITGQVTIIQEERSKHFHVWLFPYYPWMAEQFSGPVSEYRDVIRAVKERPPAAANLRQILDTAAIIGKELQRPDEKR